MSQAVAECVGLWLAEGNNKCHNEITFTNNCTELITRFHTTLHSLFPTKKIRVYCYSKSGGAECPVKVPVVRRYVDTRARKPYFIWRLASVDAMSYWKAIVHQYLGNAKAHSHILRGFFAGEGSVKTGKHHNRVLRIAQKERKPFIDALLKSFGITYAFYSGNRTYEITGKWNWDIFQKYKLAELHPLKRARFQEIYGAYQEEHYPSLELRRNVLAVLAEPFTARTMANRFHRSQARIAEILVALKKEGLAKNFRVGSTNYWVHSDYERIIISPVKERYLSVLSDSPQTTAEIQRHIGVDYKSVERRLRELEKLALVVRGADKRWTKTAIANNITIL